MTIDWYSPGSIKFDSRTTLWLVQSLNCLRDGYWPPEASGYIDAAIRQKNVSKRTQFATPIEFAAEISERLEKCGIDGLILEAIESWGKSEETMARYLRMPTWSIRKRAKKALAYVSSGPTRRWHNSRKRKGETYQQFKVRKHRPHTIGQEGK